MNKLYALAGRVAYFFVRPVWIRFNHNKPRVRLLLVHQGRVLLVVNWLSSQSWRLPGGGVGKNESLLSAARRELHEELGIDISPKKFKYLGAKETMDFKIPLRLEIFLLERDSEKINRRVLEILDAKWFDVKNLPANRLSVVDNAIALYRGDVDNSGHST